MSAPALLAALLLAIAPSPPPNAAVLTLPSSGGGLLSATLSWPAGQQGTSPALVAVGEHPGLAQPLNAAGFAVVSIDAASSGDVAAAVTAAAADPHVDPDRIYLLGLGAGAAAAAEAAAGGVPVRGLVLLDPLATPGEIAAVAVPILLLREQDAGAPDAGTQALISAARSAHRRLDYGAIDGDDALPAAITAWAREIQ
ncbi:MAG TPA: hypothetical protein VMH02_04490 [Verrucomicrobiae bacterium]|nr:hypothetical protein [Verrucomicrobiae bacterium]